jgi:Fur family iron response transcriptional regulator
MRKPQKRNRESIAQQLRRQGITPTHQRMEIAHVLFTRREHLSADQILSLVNSRYAETSKATVYNTLKLFVEKKLIRELVIDPAKVVYDPNTEPHHHLSDVVSGRLTDLPADNIRVVGLPPLPQGTVAEGVDIIVRTRPQD